MNTANLNKSITEIKGNFRLFDADYGVTVIFHLKIPYYISMSISMIGDDNINMVRNCRLAVTSIFNHVNTMARHNLTR